MLVVARVQEAEGGPSLAELQESLTQAAQESSAAAPKLNGRLSADRAKVKGLNGTAVFDDF